MMKRIWFDDLPDDQRVLRHIGKTWRRAHGIYRRVQSPFRAAIHRSITRYLHTIGRAARDGYVNGGYIVWMSQDTYHDYTKMRERTKQGLR